MKETKSNINRNDFEHFHFEYSCLKKLPQYFLSIVQQFIFLKVQCAVSCTWQDVQTWPRLKSCPFTPESHGDCKRRLKYCNKTQNIRL